MEYFEKKLALLEEQQKQTNTIELASSEQEKHRKEKVDLKVF
jgi:hypothetical protein